MTERNRWSRVSNRRPGTVAVYACAACLAWTGAAFAAPSVEARVMTQLGLDVALNLSLLQNEIDIINNNEISPPACAKLPYGGSIETLSVNKLSANKYRSKIDIYFDPACKTPYVEADVTVAITNATKTVSIAETASYRDVNGKALGQLSITDSLSLANKIETLAGLGKFAPAGGQPAADVGFTCSIPTAGNAKTLDCQGGVAQTFKLLDLDIASVVPFSITAAADTDAPKITFAGTESNVQTGPAGSLSITAPAPGTLGIAGGGTAYTSTAMSGSEGHYALFPPQPTSWTVTDTKNGAKFAYRIVSNATRAAHGTVAAIEPAKKLASIALDKSGSGKVNYSDGSPAAVIRSFLAAN